MKTKLASQISLLAAAAAFFLPFNTQAQKVAQGSGDWPGITWSPAGDPGLGDFVNIGNGYSVNYVDSGLTRVGRVHVGSDEGGFTPNGTLTVSSGTLQTSGSGSIAVQVGFSTNATAILNINGGTVNPDGGWVTVGNGANSMGTVNLSSGSVDIPAGNLSLGSADGSTGVMNMTGGSLDVSGTFFAGRSSNNDNHGEFNQSGGIAAVSGPFRIGNATTATMQPSGAVTLTGGITAVDNNIVIGNTSSGVLGEGSLFVGPNANLFTTATDSTLLLGGNSELRFVLGSDDSFNAIDLTSNVTSAALSFLAGSLISIDGSDLPFAIYDPINLISFTSGFGPNSTSLDNISYNFLGFDPGLNYNLDWTATNLVLTVVPEPATSALLLGLCVLAGMIVVRRRRMVAGR